MEFRLAAVGAISNSCILSVSAQRSLIPSGVKSISGRPLPNACPMSMRCKDKPNYSGQFKLEELLSIELLSEAKTHHIGDNGFKPNT